MNQGARLASAVALATLLGPLACSQSSAPESGSNTAGKISGTVMYLKRISLPTDAEFTVELRDVSRQDVPAPILASTTVISLGRDTPVPFTLSFDPTRIDERGQYVVHAEIRVDGNPRLATVDSYPVLTRGNPTESLALVLRPTASSRSAS